MSNSIKVAIATLNATALDLETVPRNPDGVVDVCIRTIRHMARHALPFSAGSALPKEQIDSYVSCLRTVADALQPVQIDSPGGTLTDAIKDLLACANYISKIRVCEADLRGFKPEPKGVPGGYADGDAYRQPVESIQVPPSLRGEPADALDKPARQYSAEDQARIDAGLKPFTAPQPTAAELLVASGTTRMVKKDASKGESIVQACAQIRGLISDNAHGIWRQQLLDQISAIEDQAFAKDTPTFALNANGKPLDDEQVELISRIKDARRELVSLANSTKNYLLAKQKRLRAICDANPCHDVDHELTEAQAAAYKAYTEFCEAEGYGWLDRGVSDVQVGVMSLVRAVAGPAE